MMTDQIMHLAGLMADAKAAHAAAVHGYVEHDGPFESVSKVADEYVVAEQALRTAVESAVQSGASA